MTVNITVNGGPTHTVHTTSNGTHNINIHLTASNDASRDNARYTPSSSDSPSDIDSDDAGDNTDNDNINTSLPARPAHSAIPRMPSVPQMPQIPAMPALSSIPDLVGSQPPHSHITQRQAVLNNRPGYHHPRPISSHTQGPAGSVRGGLPGVYSSSANSSRMQAPADIMSVFDRN